MSQKSHRKVHKFWAAILSQLLRVGHNNGGYETSSESRCFVCKLIAGDFVPCGLFN